MKKGRVGAKYDETFVKAHRTFPTGNTVLLVVIIALQIGLVVFGLLYQPQAQDVIHQYDVIVTPLEDGSLDIEYSFLWEALDEDEPLTWVDIGMANADYSLYWDSRSSNIQSYSMNRENDYVYLRLYFNDAYYGGDVVNFSFKINQKQLLCRNEAGYFYEFVPCWFNAIRVENYQFVWRMDGGDQKWTGSLDYGEYCIMQVQYDENDFAGQPIVKYAPFDDSGAYNELRQDVLIPCCVFAFLLIFVEVYIIDSYVSYSRGRGFLTGHGYHVHTYGRSNPHFVRAHSAHMASSGGRSGGRSGGCACACACACAGGGRAGCSQKDTFGTKTKSGNEER